MSSPPARSSRSTTVTCAPRRASSHAAASPQAPSPPRQPAAHPWKRAEPARTTVCPFPIGNGALVVVDGRGFVAHPAKVARSLAKGRAHTTRELRQGRGQRQPLGSLGPSSAIHELVPLRDEVVERTPWASAAKRTAHLTKHNPAHHAAARLSALGIFIEVHIELVVVVNALAHRAQRMRLAIPLRNAPGFPIDIPSQTLSTAGNPPRIKSVPL